tara:strand:+ start:145 stop:291 length:147 start_codon:yes stop_codon:yes gene_type:complete
MLLVEVTNRNKFAVHLKPIEFVPVSWLKTRFLTEICIAALSDMTSLGA